MKYELKKRQPPYEVVDGPYAGRKYTHGVTYTEIPAGDTDKFRVVKPARPAKTAPEKGGKK